MKKILFASLLSVMALSAMSQVKLIAVTKTQYFDQNGSMFPCTSEAILVSTQNISSVETSGSGAIIMLSTPQKLDAGIITGYSVTSTPSQINTLFNSTAATFGLSAGTVSAPSGAWADEAASGFYRIGANNYGYSINGTKVWEIASTGVSMHGLTTMTNAAASAATLATITNTDVSISGTLTTTGIVINGGTPQTLTGAGAVNLTTYSTLLVTTGANALTLAAGTEGQHKFIRMKTDGGDGTLTVTNLQGGTTLTFNDAGDFVELYYLDAKWHIIVNSGATLA